jgi:hypothetical protein
MNAQYKIDLLSLQVDYRRKIGLLVDEVFGNDNEISHFIKSKILQYSDIKNKEKAS